ncbi:hypothetical protein E2C01_079615 [Portunus trituberculatus]|uniref:Uncharacterized protein n=1 Tax=Portunus trituberculatus TaxID=210409 RepID=A0A5B7IQT0_PORTR|nr:hypothetical protein [Portunus trituberculatus]
MSLWGWWRERGRAGGEEGAGGGRGYPAASSSVNVPLPDHSCVHMPMSFLSPLYLCLRLRVFPELRSFENLPSRLIDFVPMGISGLVTDTFYPSSSTPARLCPVCYLDPCCCLVSGVQVPYRSPYRDDFRASSFILLSSLITATFPPSNFLITHLHSAHYHPHPQPLS